MEVFLGITGASGSPYAARLARTLTGLGHTVGVSFSGSGATVMGQELHGDLKMDRDTVIQRFCADTGVSIDDVWAPNDYASPYASGSARWDAAVICPCSMSTLGTIAAGGETNLLQRAANVALKEDRRLILVPRETPLSMIQLENMLRVKRAGGHILPAMPGFYHNPTSLDEIFDFVVGKVLNLMGIDNAALAEWRNQQTVHTDSV